MKKSFFLVKERGENTIWFGVVAVVWWFFVRN
jgi:hypothetical protein